MLVIEFVVVGEVAAHKPALKWMRATFALS
jgi:hypothetical protein